MIKLKNELYYFITHTHLVCVIGSGAGGLCAIRLLLKHKDKFDIEAFEKSDQVGGTWVYDEHREKDKYGLPVYSSMYANLR